MLCVIIECQSLFTNIRKIGIRTRGAATFWTMKNELRINVYVGRTSRRATSASRVDGAGRRAAVRRAAEGGRATGGPPQPARDWLPARRTATLHIDRGANTRVVSRYELYRLRECDCVRIVRRGATRLHILVTAETYTSHLYLKLRHTFHSLTYSSLLSLIIHDVDNEYFFFNVTLYPAGRGNLVSRHFVPHF